MRRDVLISPWGSSSTALHCTHLTGFLCYEEVLPPHNSFTVSHSFTACVSDICDTHFYSSQWSSIKFFFSLMSCSLVYLFVCKFTTYNMTLNTEEFMPSRRSGRISKISDFLSFIWNSLHISDVGEIWDLMRSGLRRLHGSDSWKGFLMLWAHLTASFHLPGSYVNT